MSSERIPGIKELRQRVYKSEEIYGRIPWISKRFIHPHISIYLTWFFLHVRMSRNKVTLLMLLCGALGPLLYFVGGTKAYIAGSVFMLLSWIIDHSDGEVGRYRNQSSKLGIYMDHFAHRFSYPLVFLALGGSLFRETGEAFYLGVGGVVAYLYQLIVVHELDRQMIWKEKGGVEPYPMVAGHTRLTTRFPAIRRPLKLGGIVFLQLAANKPFYLLMIFAAWVGWVAEYFVLHGTLVAAHWVLTVVFDFTVSFRGSPAHRAKMSQIVEGEAVTAGEEMRP